MSLKAPRRTPSLAPAAPNTQSQADDPLHVNMGRRQLRFKQPLRATQRQADAPFASLRVLVRLPCSKEDHCPCSEGVRYFRPVA